MEDKNNPQEWKYVFFKPASLHPYLKIFAHPESEIEIEEEYENVSEMKHCKGIDGINPSHTFLACEGSYTCVSCNECFCGHCRYSPAKDRDGRKTKNSLVYYNGMDNDMCVDCYKQRVFLPYSCTLADVLSI